MKSKFEAERHNINCFSKQISMWYYEATASDQDEWQNSAIKNIILDHQIHICMYACIYGNHHKHIDEKCDWMSLSSNSRLTMINIERKENKIHKK